jgi:hypothetical protein
MNAMLHVTPITQVNTNELRALSHSEQIEINGGRACYKNRGGANKVRYVESGRDDILIKQVFVRGKYVSRQSIPLYLTNQTFVSYCRSVGFRVFR